MPTNIHSETHPTAQSGITNTCNPPPTLFSYPPPSSPLTGLSNTRPHPIYRCAVSSSRWSRVPRGVIGAGLGVLSTLLAPSHCPGVHKRVHRRRKRRGRQEVNKKKKNTAEFCCATARAWGPSGKICPCLCQHSRFFVDFLHFPHSQIYCAIHELLSAFFLLAFGQFLHCFVCASPHPHPSFFPFFFFLGGDLYFHNCFAWIFLLTTFEDSESVSKEKNSLKHWWTSKNRPHLLGLWPQHKEWPQHVTVPTQYVDDAETSGTCAYSGAVPDNGR